MSITPGFTTAEIRELVAEYQLVPHGQKGVWCSVRGLPGPRMRRWQAAVFAGDLDRGLVPREGGVMSVPPGKRTAFERARAAEQAAHEVEVAKLHARVEELEETNTVLGKAIGLLHAMSEQEPDATPAPTDPLTSSPPKTNSSPI